MRGGVLLNTDNDCPLIKPKKKEVKNMKLTLATIGATALLSIAAFAGELVPVQVNNGHGQFVTLNRSSETTIALSSNGRGAGKCNACSKELKAISRADGHGGATIMHRAE